MAYARRGIVEGKCCDVCRKHTDLRQLTVGFDDYLCCITCVDQLTRECVPTFYVTTPLTLISPSGTGNVATHLTLSDLWFWPTDEKNVVLLPTSLIAKDGDYRCLGGSLSDVAARFKLLGKAYEPCRFFEVLPDTTLEHLRAQLRLTLVRKYGPTVDQGKDDVLTWKVPRWSHPQRMPGVADYRPSMTDVEKEEAVLPGLIADVCGLPAPLAALVYVYRRPLLHVAKLVAAQLAANIAWSDACARLNVEHQYANEAAHLEHAHATAAKLVAAAAAAAACATKPETRAAKRLRVA